MNENNDDNKEEKRYCDPFNMSAQQFLEWKEHHRHRIWWYILGMIICTFCYGSIYGYAGLTFLLIALYYHDDKVKEQWIKDGSATEEDFKY